MDAEIEIIENTERQGYAILGISESEKLNFVFYPHPVGDSMTIDSSEKIQSYEIIGMLGQSLFKGTSEENVNEAIPSLTSGAYLLRIVTDSGKKQTFRFIKK